MSRLNPLAAMKQLGRHLVAGAVFMVGALLTVAVAYAFQNSTASPADPGFQSGSAYMLSDSTTAFNRDQHSLVALSKKIDTIVNGEGAIGAMVGYARNRTATYINLDNPYPDPEGTVEKSCSGVVTPATCSTVMSNLTWDSGEPFYPHTDAIFFANPYGLNDVNNSCKCEYGETFAQCVARLEAQGGQALSCIPKVASCPANYQKVTLESTTSSITHGTVGRTTTSTESFTCMRRN